MKQEHAIEAMTTFVELTTAELDDPNTDPVWARRFAERVLELVGSVAQAPTNRTPFPVPIDDPETPELYNHLGGLVVEVLVAEGMHDGAARNIAEAVVGAIRRDFGGDSVYFPKCSNFAAREIIRRWKAGEDSRALAHEFGISLQHCNMIIRNGYSPRREMEKAKSK